MRFVDTDRFSPVAKKVSQPWEEDYFHTPVESISSDVIDNSIVDENWWYEQYDRCINGYEVEFSVEPGGDAIVDGVDAIWHGNDVYLPEYDHWIRDRKVKITGRHYFYLNFWIIYGMDDTKGHKGLINPRFLDMDYLFFLRIECMKKWGKDSQELKGRQMGFSEKGAGGVIGYNFIFVDGSLNVIVGGIEDDALKTMRDCRRGLDRLENTQFFKELAIGGKSSTFLQAKHTGSQIHCLTAKDNPQTVSRFSPYWVWFEEIGKGKKNWSIETAGYIKPSIEVNGIKSGYMHYIGTGGEMEDGVYDLEERHYKPNDYNILSFKNNFDDQPNKNQTGYFTSKTWFYKIDKDGNSLRELSKKELLHERALKSAKERFLHTTQYPIYANEVFYTSGSGYFGEVIIQNLNERAAFLNNHRDRDVIKRGHLEWISIKDKTKGVKFIADPDGPFEIMEHPEEDHNSLVPLNLYYAGTDSYDQDVSTTDSEGAIVIRKKFYQVSKTYNKWVAKLLQRPSEGEGGADRFYENTALLCAYYSARNLIEFTKWRIIDWYDKNGCAFMLKERPASLLASFVNKSESTNRFGIDAATKRSWLNFLREKLSDINEINRIDDIDMLRRFAKFKYDPTGKKYNCDLTIATALSLIHEMDEEDMTPTTSSKEEVEEKLYSFTTDRYGNIVSNLN